MKLEVLDTKVVNGNTWALCKGNLLEYLKSLKPNFFEFSVQRKIVSNVYLDNIYSSIEKGEPFPPVTLMYSRTIQKDSKGRIIDITSNGIEILDGLQRTYRLWVLLYFYELIKESKASDLKSLAEAAKKTPQGEIVLQNRFITPKLIKSLFNKENGKMYIESLIESYSQFEVYFYIWTGLNDSAIIRRMLILNAGQKSVSSTHQFELLFLHFFEDEKLGYNKNVSLVREKDPRYRNVQRGNRTCGEYLMSSIVIALQSFINGKQLRIMPSNLINLDDNKLLNNQNLENYFNAQTLSEFINHVYALGKKLSLKSDGYIKWYGKDTVLSGVFGAMGAISKEQNVEVKVSDIDSFIEIIDNSKDPFELGKYDDAYENKLVSKNVNVGNAVRKAIFNYTKDLLMGKTPDWERAFINSKNYDEG